MANLSQEKRKKMIKFLDELKSKCNDDKSIGSLNEIRNHLLDKKYGLVWEEHSEQVEEMLKDSIPVFTEDIEKKIVSNESLPYNFILEGDNLQSLYLLEKTHKGRIDVIYIDPPYNTGNNEDFKYDDDYVEKEDSYRHSKWLSFMERRLLLAKTLLNINGVLIIHIDEHELENLALLADEIFNTNNKLGCITWNKLNPKGDSKGIAVMHEYILCYAKDKESFCKLNNALKRKKKNAISILSKAKTLYKNLDKKLIPTDVLDVIRPFNYPDNIINEFKVRYDLNLINSEFQNWLKQQNFSDGEKAYKYIDEKGDVYRGVSMAWPNKKKAPNDYFIPLIHPITGKECPIPERGWRNSPARMQELLDNNEIIFGADETKQPERKYLLKEHLLENTPSIYESADSNDDLLKNFQVEFPYPKPVSIAKYLLTSIHPAPQIILDFFAGSGTTGQAVIELNKEDNGNRKFILCTDNAVSKKKQIEYFVSNNLIDKAPRKNTKEEEEWLKKWAEFKKSEIYNEQVLTDNYQKIGICNDVTYPRVKTVITGIRKDGSRYSDGLPANLKYFKCSWTPRKPEDYLLSNALCLHIKEMIELQNAIEIDQKKNVLILNKDDFKKTILNSEIYDDIERIWINQNILFKADEMELLNNKGFNYIPKGFFGQELREVAE